MRRQTMALAATKSLKGLVWAINRSFYPASSRGNGDGKAGYHRQGWRGITDEA